MLFCDELRMAGLVGYKVYGNDDCLGKETTKQEPLWLHVKQKHETNKKRRDRTTANKTWMNMNKYDEYGAASRWESTGSGMIRNLCKNSLGFDVQRRAKMTPYNRDVCFRCNNIIFL
eukprot:10037_1